MNFQQNKIIKVANNISLRRNTSFLMKQDPIHLFKKERV